MKHRPIMPSGSIRIGNTLSMSLQQQGGSRPFWALLCLSLLGTLSVLMTFLTMFVPLCNVWIVILFSAAALAFFSVHAAAPEKTHYSLLAFLLGYAIFFYWKRELLAAGLMHIINDVYQAIYYTDWEYFSTDPQYNTVLSITMSLCFAMAPITWLVSYAVIRFHNFFLSVLVTFPFVELGLFFGVVPEHYAMLGLAAFWCGAGALQLAAGKRKQRLKDHSSFTRRGKAFLPLNDLKFLLTERAGILTAMTVFGVCVLAEGLLHAVHYERPEIIKQMRTDFQYYAASVDFSDMSTVFPFLKKESTDEPDSVIELGRNERREFQNRTVSGVSLTQNPLGRVYLRYSTYQSYEKSHWRTADEETLASPEMQMFEDIGLYPPEFLYYSVQSLAAQTAELELIAPNETLSRCVPYGFAKQDKISFRGDTVTHTGTQSYKIFSGENYENLLIRTISYDIPAESLISMSRYKDQERLHELLEGRDGAIVQYPMDPDHVGAYYGNPNELKLREEAGILAAAGYTDFAFEKYTKLPDNDDMHYIHSMFGDLTDNFDARNATPAETMILLGRLRERLCANVEYTLSPGRTPPGEDFVRYFLEENKRGYCTHYATTGTILARMAGIPARYCEGYLIDNRSLHLQQTANGLRYITDILDSNAHAWVEVYIDGFGWIPFEFTFSYFTPPELPKPPEPEIVTEPVTAEDPTEAMNVTEPVTTMVPVMPETEPAPTEVTVPPEPPKHRGLVLGILAGTCGIVLIVLLISARRRAVLDKRELRLCDPIGDAGAVFAWGLILKRLEYCGVNTTAGSSDALMQECLEKCSDLLSEEEITAVIRNGTKLRYSPHGLREAERDAVIEGYRKLTAGIYRKAAPLQRLWLKWFRHYV